MNYDEAIRRARLALANSNPGWEEHKHPRRADGKFGSGGGAVGASGKGGGQGGKSDEAQAYLVTYIKAMDGHREEMKNLAEKLKSFAGEVEDLGKRIETTRKSTNLGDDVLKKAASYKAAISSWQALSDKANDLRDICTAMSSSIWKVI